MYLLALVLSALDIFGWGGRASDAAEDPPELDCRGPLEELRAAGAGPLDTTGGGVGVWGPVEAGGAGGDTGTESDPRAPVDEADINQYLGKHNHKFNLNSITKDTTCIKLLSILQYGRVKIKNM